MGAKARKGFEHNLYKISAEMKKDLSYSTVSARLERLKLMRNQLEENGYVVSHPKGFKQKHIIARERHNPNYDAHETAEDYEALLP